MPPGLPNMFENMPQPAYDTFMLPAQLLKPICAHQAWPVCELLKPSPTHIASGVGCAYVGATKRKERPVFTGVLGGPKLAAN